MVLCFTYTNSQILLKSSELDAVISPILHTEKEKPIKQQACITQPRGLAG